MRTRVFYSEFYQTFVGWWGLNTNRNPLTEKGAWYKGICPFENWQVDFTQMPKTIGNFKFLLGFIGTFAGLGEAIIPQQNWEGNWDNETSTPRNNSLQHSKWQWIIYFRNLPEEKDRTGTTYSIKTTYILETSIYVEDWENAPHNKDDLGKNVPGNTFEMGTGTPHCLVLN